MSTQKNKKFSHHNISIQHLLIEIKNSINIYNNSKSTRQICKDIAYKYGYKEETIRSIWKRNKQSKIKIHGNRMITNIDELMLVGILEAFSQWQSPLSRRQFLILVRNLYKKPITWNGTHWYYNFIHRHKKHLCERTVKGIPLSRVSHTVLDDTKAFTATFLEYLNQFHFNSNHIINADETRLSIDGNIFSEKRIESISKYKHAQISPGYLSSAGLVTFAEASGQIILSVYILSANFDETRSTKTSYPIRQFKKQLRNDWERVYLFTETSYLNDQAWNAIMDYYCSLTQERYHGVDSLLLLDKLGAHMQPTTVQKCRKKGIHTIFFPANASHFIQPLDDLCFTNFKRVLYSMTENYIQAAIFQDKSLVNLLLEVAPNAEEKAFTQNIILSSFRNTGIWPFDSKLILHRAELNAPLTIVSHNDSILSIEDRAKQATLQALESYTSQTNKRKQQRQVSANKKHKKNQIFTSYQLLLWEEEIQEENRKKEEEKQEKKREKELEKIQREEKHKQEHLEKEKRKRAKRLVLESNTCKLCGKKCSGPGLRWQGCEYCDYFWVCPQCYDHPNPSIREANRGIVGNHSVDCTGTPPE